VENFAQTWRLALAGDGVFGVRVTRQDPAHRLILTMVIRWVVRLLFGLSLRDANVPFKLIRRSLWLQARRSIPESTLAPSLFLALYCKVKGFAVLEVEVAHRGRKTGVSSLRQWQFFRFCLRAFCQLLCFRWRLCRA
jgi:hypothetical protein